MSYNDAEKLFRRNERVGKSAFQRFPIAILDKLCDAYGLRVDLYMQVLLWETLAYITLTHPDLSIYDRLNMCRETANLVSKVIRPPAEFELMAAKSGHKGSKYHTSPAGCNRLLIWIWNTLVMYVGDWLNIWKLFWGLIHTINSNTPFAILIFYLKKAVNKHISLLLTYSHLWIGLKYCVLTLIMYVHV